MNRLIDTFRRCARAAVPAASVFALGLAGASLALLAPAAPSIAQAPPAAAQTSGDLDRAVEALRRITTMKADFVQTDRNGNRVGGELTIKRPGKIRFQYEKGVPLLIVGDGHALTLIDYEVRQVQRWPIKNSPLGALLDPSRDIRKFGKLQPASAPNVVAIEVRDSSHPEYGVITLIFLRRAGAPGGLELVSWVALDSQNQRTTIRLANQSYGMEIPDKAFRFNDPRPTRRR
ncbi:MAG: outer membrane lipoprotein carrier protein LolA [Sphingomonadales bacterium]|nr:outer membrane lipoprotein carrier protein LolA [Sphingomonadales bacterium]